MRPGHRNDSVIWVCRELLNQAQGELEFSVPAALAAAPATALAARRQSLPFNIPAEADMRRRQVSSSSVHSL